MRRPRAWLAAAMLCAAAPAAAGSLTVAPTRIDLAAGRTAGAVTLHNNASEPVLVQVETFAWPRTPSTGDLEATKRLVAVPPVFSLAPDAKQVIRVALREAQMGASEEAYRLLITEVPQSQGKGGGVQFALRLSLPVFATPAGATPSPQWSLGREGDRSTLQLANSGTAHVQVQKIRLKGSDGALQTIDEPSYVLAGQQHAWNLRLPVKAGSVVAVEADTNIGTLALPLAAGGR
jgi:fimbrial chaperone protein